MAWRGRGKATVKFLFWTAAALVLVGMVVRSYRSGQMAAWYYYTAAIDGYTINADSFRDANKQHPAELRVVPFQRIDGQVAVYVREGQRLPPNATGVISNEILAQGKRAVLVGDVLKVMIPWEIQQSKGIKFKDTFKHKGIRTNPWSAVWNVAVTLGLGLTLGFMAEGFTDLIGIRVEKIRHFEGH
jgi:hypothetical protein